MDVKHTVNGICCTIDSAHVVTNYSVWVDAEDLPRALRTVGKLNDEEFPTPEVYTTAEEDSPASETVCISFR